MDDPVCSFDISVSLQPAPRRIFDGGGIYNFKAKFNWTILKNLKQKSVYFSFLAISPLIMVRFQKIKSWLTAQDLFIGDLGA